MQPFKPPKKVSVSAGARRGRPSSKMKSPADYARLLREHGELLKANVPHPSQSLAKQYRVPRGTVTSWLSRGKAMLQHDDG